MKDTAGCGGGSAGAAAARECGCESSLREALRRAMLHELPVGDRLLLMLWYAEGMSPDEIAACLHSTPGQVESAHTRVLDRLRRVASEAPAGA